MTTPYYSDPRRQHHRGLHATQRVVRAAAQALRRARAAGWTGTYHDDTKRGK